MFVRTAGSETKIAQSTNVTVWVLPTTGPKFTHVRISWVRGLRLAMEMPFNSTPVDPYGTFMFNDFPDINGEHWDTATGSVIQVPDDAVTIGVYGNTPTDELLTIEYGTVE